MRHQLKILMIVPQPFFTPRGTPHSVRGRLQALSALGHQVDVITYHVGTDIHLPNLRIYRTPRIGVIQTVPIGPSLTKVGLDVLLFARAVVQITRERYDVIYTHEEAGVMGAVLAPLIRAQHVYDMHSSLPQQFGNFQVYNYRPVVRIFESAVACGMANCVVVFRALAQGQFQRPQPFRLHFFDDELVVAARLVDRHPAAPDHFQAVLQVELQPQGDAAPDHRAQLAIGILEREVQVPRFWPRQVRHLAPHPEVL